MLHPFPMAVLITSKARQVEGAADSQNKHRHGVPLSDRHEIVNESSETLLLQLRASVLDPPGHGLGDLSGEAISRHMGTKLIGHRLESLPGLPRGLIRGGLGSRAGDVPAENVAVPLFSCLSTRCSCEIYLV
jgi:hypothetical protein